jgi:DNA helicase-2/ATP-dependent DNA helicase PcrA
MYRTNAQSRALEEAFIRGHVRYRLVGAQRFYGRKEIKDVVAYLRLIHNPADSVSLLRVLNTPPRGIGTKSLEQLQAHAHANGLTLNETVLGLGGLNAAPIAGLGGKALAALTHLSRLLNHWHATSAEVNVGQLLDTVLERIGYKEFLNDGTEEGTERWDNVIEFRGVAHEATEASLAEFLENVALVSDQDTVTQDEQAPTLLTLHAAKGLEFPIVFIIGLDEGVLPHQRSFDDPEAMHEERRLMYVGLTRAKDRLYLLRAFRRSMYGDSALSEISRFLTDIPSKLLTGNLTHKQARAETYYKRATTWDGGTTATDRTAVSSPASAPTGAPTGKAYNWSAGTLKKTAPTAAPPTPTHRSGPRVRHAHFGEGLVIETKFISGDEEVIIAFTDVGLKRLALSVAKLEVLKG